MAIPAVSPLSVRHAQSRPPFEPGDPVPADPNPEPDPAPGDPPQDPEDEPLIPS